jgi:hypothetical protein
MFGDHRVCGAFPTSSPLVRRPQSILVQVAPRLFFWRVRPAVTFFCQDTPHLVRLHSARVPSAPYMCFDEAYFKTLESMQWNRDNGCVELIPIVVGLP